MVTLPIGSMATVLNLGALVHKVGKLFPSKWIPENWLQKGVEENDLKGNSEFDFSNLRGLIWDLTDNPDGLKFLQQWEGGQEGVKGGIEGYAKKSPIHIVV
ncbi:hypothetical protein DSO57_1027302 [Entomophthora muscae]|uniref:Uncharacterized protein n=1 Tax=Entomophthora muscae TaxID=34485 RepID=A0ACC2RGH5_9FUNG|nr:hypothetical protein DSO57_1027302 [Entomophthora muscae]